MTEPDISLGELTRSVNGTVARLEELARRLESGQFVRSDNFLLYERTIELQFNSLLEKINQLERDKAEAVELSTAKQEIADLKDDKKWLTRLVATSIVLAIMAGLFAANGGVPS